MVEPLSVRDVERWKALQESDISRRRQFRLLSKPTQQVIVNILVQAEEIASSGNQYEAQQYILETIWAPEHQDRPYKFKTDDQNGMDWSEVYNHIIRGGCFYDDDMEGLRLMPHKLGAEITVLRNLMELEPSFDEFF